MLESTYQARVIKRLHDEFPGCFVMKNDSDYIQGVPDLTILYRSRWAVLEVKPRESAPYRPNQEYYLEKLGQMSFSATIFPENEEEVFHALQRSLAPRRAARIPQRE